MKTILIAGASGYLGKYLVKEGKTRGYKIRVLLRRDPKPREFEFTPDEVFIGQATDPNSLTNLCEGIDVVISSLGITRQKDGLSYMDVDYGANWNILQEALKSKTERFVYTSVLNGQKFRSCKLIDAKECFVDQLKNSPIKSTIIRPTGFFSDMGDFLQMARKGKVYLFGDGSLSINPIDGEDLAEEIFNALERGDEELPIGGPETYTFTQLAELSFRCAGKKGKISYLPDILRKMTLSILPRITPLSFYGPIEFFLTAMSADGSTKQYGKKKLEDFYRQQVEG